MSHASPIPSTMNAVRIHGYGGPEVLRYEQAPVPTIASDDVLVRVHAASVNPVDWKVRQGYLTGMINYPLPMIPGWDVAGEIVEVGGDVEGWSVGDAIFSRPEISRNGSYAEYIAIRSKEIAAKPKTIDWQRAAAVPLAALTAWQCLDAIDLQAGQSVLIHAGAGGVGNFAIQFSKVRGAKVTTTCSTSNIDLVKSLGADDVIDYKKEDFGLRRGFDAVLDSLGNETQHRSFAVLEKGGKLVSIVGRPSVEIAAKFGVTGHFVFVQPNAEQLRAIAHLIDEGKIQILVDKVYPLSQAREAQEYSQSGRARGKIVLQVA